jgi:Icc-related predicted phosphoesterase
VNFLPSVHTKKFTRLFYATDIHGSYRCYKKFLATSKFYDVDVLVCGGDITGKRVISIVEQPNGGYVSNFLGRDTILKSRDEAKLEEARIRDAGFYPYYSTRAEVEELQADPTKLNLLFVQVMKQTLNEWIELAEEKLGGSRTICYITGGNDDYPEIIEGLRETEHVKNPDNKVVKIDDIHEMASIGWSNLTPWHTPRECSEEELEERIGKFLVEVHQMNNCIFNFHVPPIDSTIDTCPKLDDSVFPPKPIMRAGSPVVFGAGSKAVRDAITKYQPLLGLHGHIHESRGVYKIGKTICINPGSEYMEGILRGVIVTLGNQKVMGYQLTSG